MGKPQRRARPDGDCIPLRNKIHPLFYIDSTQWANRKILERICHAPLRHGERDHGNYSPKSLTYRSIKVKNSFPEAIYTFIGKTLWHNRRKNSAVGNFFRIFVTSNHKFTKKDTTMKRLTILFMLFLTSCILYAKDRKGNDLSGPIALKEIGRASCRERG